LARILHPESFKEIPWAHFHDDKVFCLLDFPERVKDERGDGARGRPDGLNRHGFMDDDPALAL